MQDHATNKADESSVAGLVVPWITGDPEAATRPRASGAPTPPRNEPQDTTRARFIS